MSFCFLQLFADSNPQLFSSEAFDLVHDRLLNIGDHVIELVSVLLQRLSKQLPGFLDAIRHFSSPEHPPKVLGSWGPLQQSFLRREEFNLDHLEGSVGDFRR
jgi:hypothetical protein